MNIGNQLVCITTKSTQEVSYVQHTYAHIPLPITLECAIVHCTSSVLSLFSGCFSSTKGHPPHSEVTQVVKRVRQHNYYDYILCMYLSTYVRTYVYVHAGTLYYCYRMSRRYTLRVELTTELHMVELRNSVCVGRGWGLSTVTE